MLKRRADIELTQDNWDDDVEPAKAGTFEKAEKDVITNRKILTAKSRRSANLPAPGLFKSLTGFSNATQATEVHFNFGLNRKQVDTACDYVVPNSSLSPNAVCQETEYLGQLQTLNRNLLDWVGKHVKDDPHCILSPIFVDYDEHLKLLNDKYPLHKVSFGKLEGNTTAPKQLCTTAAESFSTSVSTASETTLKTSVLSNGASLFSTSLPVTSTGLPAKPVSSFSLPPFPSSGSVPSLFKFGTSLPSTSPFADQGAVSANQNVRCDEDDEPYQPPKPVVKEITEDGSVYTSRCKLFYRADTDWKERGVGNLFIKPLPEDKFQLLVRADTNLGNILLNILITKDIPIKLQKNNLTFVCVPSPPLPTVQSTESGEPTKPVPMLLRVKSEEGAAELLKQFDRYRGLAASG